MKDTYAGGEGRRTHISSLEGYIGLASSDSKMVALGVQSDNVLIDLFDSTSNKGAHETTVGPNKREPEGK